MKTRLSVMLLVLTCCAFFAHNAKAQDIYTYSDVTYDGSTNTVTGYAQTQGDYNTAYYYGTVFAQGMLKDANGTSLNSGTASAYGSGTASLTIQASGDGSATYEMASGHYILLSYYVTNTWSACYGYNTSGWYDFYNYYQTYYGEGNPDLWSYYDFFGPGPTCTVPSEDVILGGSSASVTNGSDDVLYDTASLTDGPYSASFNQFNTAHLDHVDCGGSRFGVKVTFSLPPNYSINGFDAYAPSPNLFAKAPSPVDGTYVECTPDAPYYCIMYFKHVNSTGSKTVSLKLVGTRNDGTTFNSTASVGLTCQ